MLLSILFVEGFVHIARDLCLPFLWFLFVMKNTLLGMHRAFIKICNCSDLRDN
jgi:hypothetical protein